MTVKITRAGSAHPCIQAPGVTALGSLNTWAVVFYLEVSSENSTNEIQTIFSNGALVSGALNIGYGGPSHPDPNTVHFTINSSTNRYKAPNGSFPPGWKGVVAVQRTGTAEASIFWCPVLTKAPTDDSAVLSALNVYSLYSGLSGLSRPGISWGARQDKLRGCDQTLARCAVLSGNLTKLEIARLAYGEDLFDMGKAPLNYARLDNATDIANRGTEADATNVFTRTGAFTDGAAPGWGYVPAVPMAPEFSSAPTIDSTPVVGMPVTASYGSAVGYPTPQRLLQWMIDGLDILGATGTSYTSVESDLGKALQVRDIATNDSGTDYEVSAARTVLAQATGVNAVAEIPHKVIQRLPVITGTSAPVSLSGTYDGVAVSAEARLLAADGTTVSQDWTTITGAAFANQEWSGKLEARQGGPYRHQVRFKDVGGAVIGTTPVASTTWNVGALFAVAGSSTGEGWFSTGTFTARSDVFKFRFSAWSGMTGTSNGPACLFANAMAVKLGIPVGMIAYASSGTTLDDWLRDSSVWTAFAGAVNGRGGKLEGLLMTVGSNDANESAVGSVSGHLTRLGGLLTRIKTLTGQQDLQCAFTGMNARLSAPAVQVDRVHEAESLFGDSAGVFHVQTADLEVGGDNAHLTSVGYADTLRRVNFQWPMVSGNAYKRGPKPTKFEFQGNRVRVTVQHRSGTQIVVPANASGMTVSDDNGARTIASFEAVSATQFDMVVDQPLVGTVVTRHMAGNWPARSAPIVDNSATPLPLAVETLLATVAGDLTVPNPEPAPDTTAPVMSGAITIVSVSTAGATASLPAATDNVGVAGYEYSINGGTSWVNVGTSPSVSVTGLHPATAYTLLVRAYDLAGNRAAPLSRGFTTSEMPPWQGDFDASKVAAARKVTFPGGTRVVVFGSNPSSAVPGGPFYSNGKWTIAKHALDEFYCVGDIGKDLTESETAALTVEAIVQGVTLLEQPVVQGHLIPVKLGGLDLADGALNFCTLRVVYENGEQVDFTIWFVKNQDTWSLNKDPDDKRFYVAGWGNILADSNTQVQAALPAAPVGVVALVQPVMQGDLMAVKLGGMATATNAPNYCTLGILCANGEKFFRSINFNRVDN